MHDQNAFGLHQVYAKKKFIKLALEPWKAVGTEVSNTAKAVVL